jgi:2-dehydropantoate 2-reductase
VQEEGLTLVAPDGRVSTVVVRAVREPREAGPADVALILVKSYQTAQGAVRALEALTPGGFAVTLQNGLSNVKTLVEVLGRERVVAGTTAEGATMVAPGKVQHAGRGLTHLARPTGRQEQVAALAAVFEEGGFVTHLVDEVDSLLWGKLAINAGINPLTALLEVPNGFLAENPSARTLMEAAATEVEALARALQISLPYEDAARRAYQVALATSANDSSMLQDVQKGRPTELQAINGAVVRLGRQAGVPVPVNGAMLALLEQKLAGKPWREAIARLDPAVQGDFAALLLQGSEGGRKREEA